jgi:hypothetical protein
VRQADLDAYYYALLHGSSGLADMAFEHTEGTLFASEQPSRVYFRDRGTCYRCAYGRPSATLAA